jgi:SAM-dependent methyltransferase
MLLDVGCGPGRLAIGLLSVLGRTNYLGLDVNANAIRWCQQHIERQHPSFRFQHVDVANDRYNRDGVGIDEDFRFDLPAGEFDAIYLYSVFTHMLEADVRAYLREFRRILKPRGRVFLTATVDEGVPRVTVNAPGYVANLMGPLHVVRYEKTFFFSLVKDAGFDVSEFVPFGDARSQSVFFLQRAYE